MKRLLLAAATAASMLTAGMAQAITFTYAAYNESGAWQSLKFTNNGGATPSGTLSSLNAPGNYVSFKFFDDPSDGIPLPADLTNDNLAYLNLNATSSTAAFLAGPNAPGTDVTQNFDSGTISFTGAVGPHAGANLLTITFTKMKLSGTIGEDAASTISSTPSSTMTITSDFFNFSSVTGSNFALTMTAMVPSLAIGANGMIDNFSANSGGTFASNPAPTFVPEPGMIGLFGLGALGLGLARRRK